MRTSEIAKALNKKTSNISNMLSKMSKEGSISNSRTGYYCIPNIDITNEINENNVIEESSESDESDETSES